MTKNKNFHFIWTLFGVCLLTQTVQTYEFSAKFITEYSQTFGQNIYDQISKMSAIQDLRIDYIIMGPKLKKIAGQKLSGEMSSAIETLLKKKEVSLEKLHNRIQLNHQQHVFDETLKLTYPDSMNVNASEFELRKSSRFNGMMINLTMSTVHIPNKVFEKSPDVLNGVAWSTGLDEVFKSNMHTDYDSKWQFFCSASGFLRMFPGATWQKTRSNQIHPNAYDCRMQKWYIQAATSPKAVVFALDVGDGLKSKKDFAEKTLKYFLDSLSDEDLFNVVYFSSVVRYSDDCFNASLLYATTQNKEKVLSYFEKFEWSKSKSNYKTAMTEVLSIFNQLNTSSHNDQICNKVMVLISSSVPEDIADIFANYNTPLFNVRVFIYLMERHKKSMEVAKQITCAHKGYHASLSTDEDVIEQILNFINLLSSSTYKTVLRHHHQHHYRQPNQYRDEPYMADDTQQNYYKYNNDRYGNFEAHAYNNEDIDNHRLRNKPYRNTQHYSQHSQDHVAQRKHPFVWTNAYEDTAGLDLVMTLACPVYSLHEKKFLGVIGIDTAINEFAKLFNKFSLGVDSKAFVINRKGHTVYHPDFKTKSKYKYEFSFNPSSNLIDIEHLEHSKDIIEIKNSMMKGMKQQIETESIQLYDNYNRVSVKNMKYYLHAINNTPFRLGIALPKLYDRAMLEGLKTLKDFDFSSWSTEQFLLSKWDYCNIDNRAETESRTDALLRRLLELQSKPEPEWEKDLEKSCNKELVEFLLFDIEASRSATNNWMKENWNYNLSRVINEGADLVYLETKSGLIRYHVFNHLNNKLEEYMELMASSVHSNTYSKAVLNGEEITTFSLPFTLDMTMKNMASTSSASTSSSYQLAYQPPSKLYHANPDDIVITASHPIIIHENAMEVVVGVVNTLLRYSWFKKILNSSIPHCDGNGMRCSKMCESEEVECYLLDFNGYVVYSENLAEVGQFFGDLEGCASSLWDELLVVNDDEDRDDTKEKGYNQKGVFHKIEITDHHAVCEVIRKSTSRSPSFVDFFSLANVFKYFFWMINEFFLCLFQFDSIEGCFFRKSKSENTTEESTDFPEKVAEVEASVDDIPHDEPTNDLESYRSLMSDLVKISSPQQVDKWKKNCLQQSSYSSEGTVSCLKNIKKAYEPGILGYRPCVQSYIRYLLDPSKIPRYEHASQNDLCSKSYSINPVPRTNLVLLTIDSMCQCTGHTQKPRLKTTQINQDSIDHKDTNCDKFRAHETLDNHLRTSCHQAFDETQPPEEYYCGRGVRKGEGLKYMVALILMVLLQFNNNNSFKIPYSAHQNSLRL